MIDGEWSGNERAVRAFTRLGFREEGRRRAAVLPKGERYDEVAEEAGAAVATAVRSRSTPGTARHRHLHIPDICAAQSRTRETE